LTTNGVSGQAEIKTPWKERVFVIISRTRFYCKSELRKTDD